jgi:hypothetical protein
MPHILSKAGMSKNPKFEKRNPKQIQMTKKENPKQRSANIRS